MALILHIEELSMQDLSPQVGIGTLVTHFAEGRQPLEAHVAPIYQTSTFGFPDTERGAAIFSGEAGYYYTRLANPNCDQYAQKIARLEALDLLRAAPDRAADEVVAGKLFSSGMAAITTAILGRARPGDAVLAQEALYSATYGFLCELAPRLGLEVTWVKDPSLAGWEAGFRACPNPSLVYAETPANPTMQVTDLVGLADLAHRHGSWLMVDNTFATPYCQRPLSLGADVVVHSTTKYLSGHGVIVGGAVVSSHLDYVRQDLQHLLGMLGGAPSPFDAWLGNLGLKTFELRMQRHCANALTLARYLESHPQVAAVYYPGLESHAGHAVARRQMHAYGGMISFELKGGLPAGRVLMNGVRLISLAVSLGMVDSLIQHPASMTHASIPAEDRRQMGLSDGLVRFSVGVENVEDLQADLEQALANI
jgi:methionine-gamma-lyase